MQIAIDNLRIELLADHAAYLPDSRTLVIADVHLGKATGFQMSGFNVPEGDDEADLQRIDRLISKNQAEHVVIAGDLFHSADGLSPSLIETLNRWLESTTAAVTLVLGNHDLRALQTVDELQLKMTTALDVGHARITHDPAQIDESKITLCGHIHPGIRIRSLKMRVPCFHLRNLCLTLPSFGSLTGCQLIKAEPSDRIFVASNGRVLELPEQFG